MRVYRAVLRTSGVLLVAMAVLCGCVPPSGPNATPGARAEQTAATSQPTTTAPAPASARATAPAAVPASDTATTMEPAPPVSEAQRLIASSGELRFSSERAEVLCEVARRNDLTTADETALVEAACDLAFSEHVASVLVALAGNPRLTPEGRAVIQRRLGCVRFTRHREQVVEVLEGRGAAAQP